MQTSQVYVFIIPGFLRVQSTNVAVTALRMWLREVFAIREQTQKFLLHTLLPTQRENNFSDI